MVIKHKYLVVVITTIICFSIVGFLALVNNNPEIITGYQAKNISEILSPIGGGKNLSKKNTTYYAREKDLILGDSKEINKVEENKISPTPTPTPIEYKVTLIDSTRELLEGNLATFTWNVDGPTRTINSTAVYFGTNSSSGALSKNISPENAGYPEVLKDFIDGVYSIPLIFVGSTKISNPGVYFARAYANIDGQHFWSEERVITVKQIPKNEIKIIDPPTVVNKEENITFNWEIWGPSATTTFTTIVIGKESKQGSLNTTIDIPQTPYTVLVKDFINGSYNVPLRFVGNATIKEPGDYYFRALAFIDNKNIWSDEYKLKVQ